MIYGRLEASQVRERASALERFARWQERHPARLDPAVALAGVAALYELLPAESRARALETAGVRAMHDALKVLAGPP